MKKRNVSIKLIWMGAYMAVVVLMCFVFFMGTLIVTREVEANLRQANEDTTSFLQKTLDDRWRRVLEYNSQLLTDSHAEKLNGAKSSELFLNAETYSFVLDFRAAMQSNQMVEDIFIYFPKFDYVVGGKGTYPSHTYWMTSCYKNRSIEYEAWKEQLFGCKDIGYFVVPNGNKLDLYYRIGIASENGRVLVAKINEDALKNTLHWICEDTENSFLAMMDESGRICGYSGKFEKFVDPETNQLLPIDETHYLCTERSSEIANLNYVAVKELSQVYHQSNAIKNIALVSLGIAFVGGVCVAVFIALRNAKPVQQLVQKFENREEISGNELFYISKQVDDLIQDNKNALEALEKQRNRMISRTFLSECLKFTQKETRPVETIAAIYGVSLENRFYSVLVRERSGLDYSSDMLEVLDEIENENDLICWTQKQDLDVVLLSYENETDITRIEEVLRQHSNQDSKIVKSHPSESPEDIRTSYLECLRQLHRKEVVLLPHTAEPKKEFDNLEGRSIMASFRKYLADEDYVNARQLIPEVCRLYLENANDLEQTCSRYAIIQQLLNLPNATSVYQQLAGLAAETDTHRFEHRLDDLLAQCTRQKLINQESDNDIAGKARCMVDELYADPILSLCTVADEIGVSQSYVSRMFKKKYSIGIAQYINEVRIENAKRLIREGSSSIKAISMQVGFSSDVQFIRVFRKIEGVTPGAYRTEFIQEES